MQLYLYCRSRPTFRVAKETYEFPTLCRPLQGLLEVNIAVNKSDRIKKYVVILKDQKFDYSNNINNIKTNEKEETVRSNVIYQKMVKKLITLNSE